MKKYRLERTSSKTGQTWVAFCSEDDGIYKVLKGSRISDIELTHLNSEVRYKRDHAPIDSNRILQTDVEVKNLAHAAMFVLATNADPKVYWKPISKN